MNARAARGRRRRGWRVCLLGSLALHAALLLWAPVSAQLRPAQGASTPAPALTVRQLFVPAAAAAAPAPAAQAAQAVPLQAIEAAVQPAPAVAPQAVAETHGADSDADVYLPRRQLDEAPRALRRVDLLWPENGPPAGEYREVISVFIDAAGVVQRVRVDGPGLPPELQDVARQAFLDARFTPGMLAGRAVRAWIRLEVSFSAEPSASSRSAQP